MLLLRGGASTDEAKALVDDAPDMLILNQVTKAPLMRHAELDFVSEILPLPGANCTRLAGDLEGIVAMRYL